MTIVWVVEPIDSELNLTDTVVGNFPVRRISSYPSFMLFFRAGSSTKPCVVFFSDCFVGELLSSSSNSDRFWLPSVKKVIVGDSFQVDGEVRDKLNHYGFTLITNNWEAISFLNRVNIENKRKSCAEIKRSYRDLSLSLTNLVLKIEPSTDEISLTKKESGLLSFFCLQPGKILSRDEIRETVWGKTAVSPRTIDSHISRLRRILQGSEVELESIYGGGYRLK